MEAFPYYYYYYFFFFFGKAPYIPKIMSLLPSSPKIITVLPSSQKINSHSPRIPKTPGGPISLLTSSALKYWRMVYREAFV